MAALPVRNAVLFIKKEKKRVRRGDQQPGIHPVLRAAEESVKGMAMVCSSEKPSGTARAFWNVLLLPQT